MLENEEKSFKQPSEVLRPSKFMRAAPVFTPSRISHSNDKLMRNLQRLIKKRIKIHKKAFSIIEDIPPDNFQSSLKFPIRTSRLSPFVMKNTRLEPLPSLTPQPRTKKKAEKKVAVVEEVSEESPIKVLKVYKKKILDRKVEKKAKKKVEIAIDTHEINFSPFEFCERAEDDDEIMMFTKKGWSYYD